MRIAMIGQKGMPASFGGVERHVHDVAVRLAKSGHDVTVYGRSWYTKKHGVFFVDGVRVVHCPSLHTKHLDTITHVFFSTVHAIARGNDIFHFHGVGPALLSFLPRVLRPKARVVTTIHSIDRKHKKWGVFPRAMLFLGEWCACRFSHAAIAVSITIRQYVHDVFGARAVYIPNGVEVHEREETVTALLDFGIVPGKYVLAVSRFIAHKRLEDIIRAWQMIGEIGDRGHAEQLVLVGGSVHSDFYASELRNLAKNDDSIIFTGFQEGVALRELFSHALCFVHASGQEGLPISVIEAMSFELPVVLSNIPEHAVLVQDYRFLFGEHDVVGFAKTLSWALSLPLQKSAMFGAENKEKVLREFVWDEIIPMLVSLYARVLRR